MQSSPAVPINPNYRIIAAAAATTTAVTVMMMMMITITQQHSEAVQDAGEDTSPLPPQLHLG